jgi:PqqD family protein of HPr-rel-A system
MSGTGLWTGPEPGRLIIEPLDGVDAVYDRRSGQTHLLGEPLPQLLDALAAGPATSAKLFARLAEAHDVTEPGDDMAAALALIAERLDELAALGLVTHRAPDGP